MDFTNQKIIITGAANGIGKATALLFDSLGANCIISDIRDEKLNELKNKLTRECLAVKADVSKFTEVENLVQKAFEKFGCIDVLINNAGIGPQQMTKVAEHTLEDWDRVIAVNQSGVFYGMKCVLPIMVEQGSGNIVNVASLAGLKASGNNLSYSASKFAVVGMTKSAALEYAKKNIRVNAVCPGYTETDLLTKLKSARPNMEEMLKRLIPMERFGEVNDIANAIVWLASDQTPFITGQTITIDGGTSL